MTKKILAAAAVAAMIAFSSASEKKAHWGYEGEHGPAHWVSSTNTLHSVPAV